MVDVTDAADAAAAAAMARAKANAARAEGTTSTTTRREARGKTCERVREKPEEATSTGAVVNATRAMRTATAESVAAPKFAEQSK